MSATAGQNVTLNACARAAGAAHLTSHRYLII
jgi:hypothetical protein